jgi:PIN domain nuclease of toxin-antitoxin system
VRLLLDTHVLLWALQDSPSLGVDARLKMKRAEAIYVSAASIWEARIKQGIGKLSLPEGFMGAIAASGFTELPVGWEPADQIGEVALPHRDPFDRLLLTQAAQEGLVLATADAVLLKSYAVLCLDARI